MLCAPCFCPTARNRASKLDARSLETRPAGSRASALRTVWRGRPWPCISWSRWPRPARTVALPLGFYTQAATLTCSLPRGRRPFPGADLVGSSLEASKAPWDPSCSSPVFPGCSALLPRGCWEPRWPARLGRAAGVDSAERPLAPSSTSHQVQASMDGAVAREIRVGLGVGRGFSWLLRLAVSCGWAPPDASLIP